MPDETTVSSTEGTHIRFVLVPAPEGFKTLLWAVREKYENGYLGKIGWFPRWRKYSFYPAGECVFEEVCMREISDFIVVLTREHKEALKALPQFLKRARGPRLGGDVWSAKAE